MAIGATDPVDVWATLTIETLRSAVLTAVLPDDDTGEAHPWVWLAMLLRNKGVAATAEELRQLPYAVTFGEGIMSRLRAETRRDDVPPGKP